MGCEFPIKAYRSVDKGPSGKPLLTFNPLRALNSTSPLQIPCNKCMGCRLEKARQWAVRMNHEAKDWPQNCFITLTYSDEAVPRDFSVDLRHWQLFMKKLRKSLDYKIRFYACGEYGDLNLRPHYHAIIFNHDFSDKQLHSYNQKGDPIYTSSSLANLWQNGLCTTQDVTFQSAGYVARYVTKKIGGEAANNHYYRRSPIDGQMYNVRPEFGVMSRRRGIGMGYVEKFKSDYYPSGFVVVNGRKQAPPRFYVSKLTEEEQTRLKRQQRRAAIRHKEHQTMERKMARSAVLHARIENLKRKL